MIYFLHGLPANPDTYKTNAFVAGALAASGQQAIVVEPQGARDQDSDREYLDWDASEDWPAAISQDLTHCVDTRFRTVRSRFGRGLVGLSAGGYGALNIGLRRLSTFGVVESWSGYFAATDPSGYHILNLGSPQANSDAEVPSGTSLKAAVTTLANVDRVLRRVAGHPLLEHEQAVRLAFDHEPRAARVQDLSRRPLDHAVAFAGGVLAADGARRPIA